MLNNCWLYCLWFFYWCLFGLLLFDLFSSGLFFYLFLFFKVAIINLECANASLLCLFLTLGSFLYMQSYSLINNDSYLSLGWDSVRDLEARHYIITAFSLLTRGRRVVGTLLKFLALSTLAPIRFLSVVWVISSTVIFLHSCIGFAIFFSTLAISGVLLLLLVFLIITLRFLLLLLLRLHTDLLILVIFIVHVGPVSSSGWGCLYLFSL